MIWQDVLLIFILSVVVTRWMYTTGYTEGYKRAQYEARQDAIRQSGNYITSPSGTLIPLPPVRGK